MLTANRLCSVLAAAAAGLLGLTAAGPAAAEDFPARPVQVISPFAPGSTDAMLRPFVERMAEFLGQPVVLNFKTGAGGAVGATAVATAKPDGYTLVGSSIGAIVLVPLANKEARYSVDSFTPVVALAEGNLMLVVPASSPYKTMKDLVEHARKNPGKVSYASSGVMGITHVLTEIVAKEAGVTLAHIPFQGSGPGINALLGGHVDSASTAVGPVQVHIRAGSLRALAVFGDARMKAYPDVPTLKELGYNVSCPVVYGLSAPKGTPKDVVDALYAAVKKTAEKYNEQIASSLAVAGAEIKLLTPQEYGAYLQAQNQLYARAVKSLQLEK